MSVHCYLLEIEYIKELLQELEKEGSTNRFEEISRYIKRKYATYMVNRLSKIQEENDELFDSMYQAVNYPGKDNFIKFLNVRLKFIEAKFKTEEIGNNNHSSIDKLVNEANKTAKNIGDAFKTIANAGAESISKAFDIDKSSSNCNSTKNTKDNVKHDEDNKETSDISVLRRQKKVYCIINPHTGKILYDSKVYIPDDVRDKVKKYFLNEFKSSYMYRQELKYCGCIIQLEPYKFQNISHIALVATPRTADFKEFINCSDWYNNAFYMTEKKQFIARDIYCIYNKISREIVYPVKYKNNSIILESIEKDKGVLASKSKYLYLYLSCKHYYHKLPTIEVSILEEYTESKLIDSILDIKREIVNKTNRIAPSYSIIDSNGEFYYGARNNLEGIGSFIRRTFFFNTKFKYAICRYDSTSIYSKIMIIDYYKAFKELSTDRVDNLNERAKLPLFDIKYTTYDRYNIFNERLGIICMSKNYQYAKEYNPYAEKYVVRLYSNDPNTQIGVFKNIEDAIDCGIKGNEFIDRKLGIIKDSTNTEEKTPEVKTEIKFKSTKEKKSVENNVDSKSGLNDTGKRTHYQTGAIRETGVAGKGRFDLVPLDIYGNIVYDDIIKNIGMFAESHNVEYLDEAIYDIACMTDEFKNEYDLLFQLAKHFENGALKYEPNNWKKGLPIDSYIDSMTRHYVKYKIGYTDEPHLVASVWNMICAIWTVQHIEKDKK